MPERTGVELSVLSVPDDLATAISAAIRGRRNPDEVELPIGWHAHDLRVVGESFPNDNGSSRQEVIALAKIGGPAYLLPEPDNRYDAKAVRVFVPGRDGLAEQIGYLPRGYDDIVDEVGRGKVAAWFKSRKKTQENLWGATLYLVRSDN